MPRGVKSEYTFKLPEACGCEFCRVAEESEHPIEQTVISGGLSAQVFVRHDEGSWRWEFRSSGKGGFVNACAALKDGADLARATLSRDARRGDNAT